jgi:hypothetical protein
MTSCYSDATKAITDLLNKAYCLDQRKLKITSKTTDGVSLTFDGKINQGKSSGSASAEIGKLHDNISLDKLSLSSKGSSNVELGINGLADGFSTTLKLEQNLSGNSRSCDIEAEYANENVNVNAVIGALNGPTVKFSGVGAFDGILVGGTASGGTVSDAGKESFAITDFGGLIGYNCSDFTAIVLAEKKCADVSVNLSHKLCSSSTLAAQLGYNTGSGTMTALFGGNYKTSSTTELQARADCCGKLGANVTTKLNGAAKLNLAAEVDLKDLASDNHKFGASLSFGF